MDKKLFGRQMALTISYLKASNIRPTTAPLSVMPGTWAFLHLVTEKTPTTPVTMNGAMLTLNAMFQMRCSLNLIQNSTLATKSVELLILVNNLVMIKPVLMLKKWETKMTMSQSPMSGQL